MERRSLLDDDGPVPDESENVFDDSFAVEEDIDVVADGFRPGHNHDREGGERQDHDRPESSTRALSELYAPSAPIAPSRNSTRKSRSHENPFSSPDDGDTEQLIVLDQAPSANSAIFAHRSLSSDSSRQFPTRNSLRIGASGPSHPYGMYPQGTMARTASVATASTAQPSQQPMSPSGPQHPYGLYPQGVGEDLDDDERAIQNSVPIGFPGHSQAFQRQRGPDGEEQDIIGFYGHTEQLPPYSRYPEDGPEKVPLLSAPEPPAASHNRPPVAGTDPGMSLMHTQLEPSTPPPQQQSMTDESELYRQPSIASNSSADGGRDSSTDDSMSEKKSWKEKSWKERRRSRVCGVPCWWYLVATSVVVFILIVVSAVVGGFVAGTQKAEQKLAPLPTTTGYDASFIATATITQQIPTGTFAVDLGPPQEAEAQCLIIPQQRPAWDCNMAFGSDVAVVVAAPNGGKQMGAYLIDGSNGSQGPLTYGSQASQMYTQFSPFIVVQDDEDKSAGPALYFQSQYDKLVVVPEGALDLSTSKIKRDASSDWYEDQIAGPSAKPWYCYFNDTLVEGFIYPKYQILPLPSGYATSTSTPYSTPAWYSQITDSPSQTITTTLTMPTTTATYTGAASAFPKWLHDHYPKFNMTQYEATHSSDPKKRDLASGGLSLYPYRMKIEERRLPGSPLPYCIQYQVLNDGDINWVPNSSGQQIIVQLSERDPPWRAVQYSPDSGGKLHRKRDAGPGSCHCQYMSGH